MILPCEHSNEPLVKLKGKEFVNGCQIYTVVTMKYVVSRIVILFILETVQYSGEVCCQETRRSRQKSMMKLICLSDMLGSFLKYMVLLRRLYFQRISRLDEQLLTSQKGFLSETSAAKPRKEQCNKHTHT